MRCTDLVTWAVCVLAQARKTSLSRSLRYMTKATAMISMLASDSTQDKLHVSTRRRSSSVRGGSGTMVVPHAHVATGSHAESDAQWPMPPEAAQGIRFQGVRGGDDVLMDVNLVKGASDARPEGTIMGSRAVAVLPAAPIGERVTSHHLSASTVFQDKRKLAGVTLGELKEKTKDAMTNTNFSLAASLSRLALTKGDDPALA